MCYPKPGPRCTAHARERLNRAKEQWAAAHTISDRHLAFAAMKDAEKQYDTTPGGQQELRDRINSEGDDGGMLSARVEHGIIVRNTMLSRAKLIDKGDVAITHHASDEEISDPIARRVAQNANLHKLAAAAEQETRRVKKAPTVTISALEDDIDLSVMTDAILAEADELTGEPAEGALDSDDPASDPEFDAWFAEQIRD